VFNGTVTQRKINQKRYEFQNSCLQVDLISDQNNLMIKNAKLQRNVAKKSVETSAEQIELAEAIYNQTILQKKEETASLTDVLLADNALREAQQSYLNAVIEYLKADIDLKKLTGNISTTK
jgi:outer membrane protein TolC